MKKNYLSTITENLIKANKLLIIVLVVLFSSMGTTYAQNCTVNAGVTQSVCENEGLTLYGGFTGVWGGAFYWLQISGPSVIIDDPGAQTTTVTGITGPSTLGFRFYGRCGDGSIVWDEVTHTILPISDADAGADDSSCPGVDVITMSASSPGAGESGLWSFIGNNRGVTINNTSSPTTTLTLSETNYGTASLVWTISSPNCASSDTVLITNCGGEMPVTSNRSGNDTIWLGACYTTFQSYRANASYPGNPDCGQMGVWNIISGPSIPSVNNINNRRATFSDLIEGTYVVEWTVSGPCASGSELLTIIVAEPVGDVTGASASGGTYCEGITEAILTGNAPLYTGETVLWTQTTGPACIIVSPTSPITAVTGLDGISNYSFSYTIENTSTACSSSDGATITYTAAPTISVGADQILSCGATSASVPYTSTGTGPVSWQIIEGPTGNPNYPTYPTGWNGASASPTIIPDLTVGGDYVVLFRKVESSGTGCANVYDAIVLSVSSDPSLANAGSAQLLACNVDTTFLVGNDPSLTGGGTGTWYQVAKPMGGNDAIIDDPTNYVTKITNLTNGLYTFRWLITGGGPSCPSSQDDVDVIVASTTPTIADAGPLETICFGTPYQLQGNPVALNEVGTWTVSPSAGVTFTDPNDHNPWIDGLVASTAYTFTWTITNACGSTNDNTTITTTSTEGPVASDAGVDQCLPSGTTVIPLLGNDPTPGAGQWFVVSSPGATSFDDDTDPTTNFNISLDGHYTIEWVISYNGCAESRDTVDFSVSALPSPSDAGPDQTICSDSTDMLAVTPLVGAGVWRQIIGPPGVIISDSTSPTATITALVDGVYGFLWTVTNGVCFGGSDTVMINASTPPDTAFAGSDQFICGASSAVMAANNITNNFAFWTMVDGPNTPSFDAEDPATAVSGMIMGTYIFTWNSINPPNCPASIDTVEIEVVPVASVTNSLEFCDTSSVALYGNPNSNGYWEQVILGTEPVINITTTGNSSAIADSLLPGIGFTDYAFRYVIDYPGCTSADTTYITIYEKPSAAAAGPDQEHCDASTFTMAGTIPVTGTGAWSILTGPGSGSFVDPTDPLSDFTGAIPGIYIFLWTVENGACNNADPIRVDNWQPPTIANADETPYQAYYCDSTIVMQGNLPVYGVGTWTQKSGPSVATIVSPILPNTEIRDLQPGRYWFYWTITNGTVCPPSIDSVEIVIAVRPTLPDAGPDQEICEVAPVQTNMAANLINIGLGTWTQFSGPNTATIASANSNTTLISDMIAGLYEFVWTANTDSCSVSDTIEVLVYELPTIAEAGSDSTFCISDPLDLYASPATIGIGTWTQMSGPSTAAFVDPNSPTTAVYNLTTGIYKFEWRTVNGPCVESYDSVQINISALPTLADAGPDQQTCEQDSVRMSGNAASVGVGIWTQVGGPPCTIEDPTLYNTDILFLQYGISTFQWTIANGACDSEDEVEITRYQLPSMADAGLDQDFCSNITSTNLDGNLPTVGSGLWTQVSGPGANIVIPASPTTEVNSLIVGSYEFLWTISTPGICPPSRDTVRITIANCAPEVLGANGLPAINGVISGLATCAETDLIICIDAIDPDGDPIDISQVNILTTSGSTWSDPIPGDTCFTYEPAAGYSGPEQLEVIVCDNSIIPECDTVIINLTVSPLTLAYAGADAEVCEIDTYTISDATASNYSALAWTTSGDGSFNDPTLLNPTYTPGPTDITAGTVSLTLTATGTGACIDAVDDMVLTITPQSIVFGGADAEICETATYTIADATAANYTTILWTTSGTGSFNDPTLVNPTYTPSPNDINDGFVVLSLTAENGVCTGASDGMTLSISKLASSYAGADAAICEIDLLYMITDALAADYDSLLWTTSGDGTYDDDHLMNPTYTVGANDILAGTVDLILTAYGSGSCVDVSDQMTLSISAQALAVAGPDDEICETTPTYTLSAAAATNAVSVLWTTDGTGTFDDPALVNPIYTPSISDIQDGQIVLSITAYGDGVCADASDFMILTIWPDPDVYAGKDDTICEGETFQPLDADVQNYVSLLWTTSGDGTFSDNTILHPVYTPGPNDLTAGTVTLSVEATPLGTCPNVTDDLVLTILAPPTAYAGIDAEICETGMYLLADATASDYNSIMWTSSGTGSFNDPTIVNPLYTPSQNDIDDGFVILTITAYANGTCVDAFDMMTLTISKLPEVYAGADAEICVSDISYTISDATAANQDSLVWTTGGDGSFDDIRILNPVYTPGANDILAGTVELILTGYGSGSCLDATDTLDLTITPLPTAFAGADAEICETAVSYTIADATATDYASLEWTTSGDGIFDNINALNPTYTPGLNDMNNGNVILTLTAYGNGSCGDVMDDMTLTISTAASAYAGMDAEICETDILYLLADATAADYDSLMWSTGGDGTFNDASILNPEYTPGTTDITSGIVILTITAYGGGSCADAIDDMTLTITLAPTAFAGADAEICETDISYTIADASASEYATLEWTTDGDGLFDDLYALNPTYTPGLNDINNGSVVLTLTAYGSGSCADVMDDMLLTISSSPIIYAGADAEICETQISYHIYDATSTAYDTLYWASSGDGSFDDINLLNATYSPGPIDIAAGSVTLTLTAANTGSCPDAIDDMLLTITAAPLAYAGANAEICETGVYQINDATASNYVSLNWETSGSGTFNDPNIVNPVYTPSVNDVHDGFVILTFTAYANGSCDDVSDFMVLSISPLPESYAGPDAAICETDISYTLIGASAANYGSVVWSTTGDGTFDNPNVETPTYSIGPNDILAGTVDLILTAVALPPCTDAVDTMTLSISHLPSAFAGPDDEMCESDVTYTLALSTATQYTTILWTTDGTGTFNDPTQVNPIYTPSISDIQDGQVRLTITAYGDGICPDASDEMLLTIWPLSDAFAGLDATICEGENYQLWDATAIDYTDILWTTSGDGFFDNPTEVNPIYNPGTGDIAGGSVVLTITAGSAGTCPDVSDDMTLSITLAPIVFAGADAEICETDTYIIADATASNYASLMWTSTGDGSFDDPTLLNPEYTPGPSDIIVGFTSLSLTAYGNVPCGEAVDQMMLTITTAPTVYAGPDAEICETLGSFMLMDATATDYDSIGWTTSGDGVFIDPSIVNAEYTPGPNDIAGGTVVLTVTAYGSGSCVDAVDDMTLTITLQATSFAGQDAEICETGVYLLADATASNYSSLMWTSTGSGSFSDPTTLNPLYTPSQNDIDDGFVILTLTAYPNGSCVEAVDAMTLEITPQPTAYAGADAAICETDLSYTILDSDAENFSSLLWTSTGDGTWDDATVLHPEYTPGLGDIANGSVDLILTAFAGGSCVDAVDTMTLFISLQPTAYAGPDDEMCESDITYTLASSTATQFISILWTTDGTGTFSDPTAINPVYTPSISDIEDGQVRLTITAYGDGVCPDASDEMLLTIWPLAEVFAGLDAIICEGENYHLWDATALDYTSILWTTSGDGFFDNPTGVNPIYNPGTGDIAGGSVVLTITAGSAGTCPDVSDDMTLSITLAPIVFAGVDAEICETDTYIITDATASNYASLMWTTTGDGSFDDPTLLNPEYTPGPSDIIVGFTTLTLTAYGNVPCGNAVDQMILTVTTAPTAYAGPDAEICETAIFYTLADALATDYASILWTTSGDGTFDDATMMNPTYTPGTSDISTGLVTLTITAFGNGSCADVSDDMELTITLAPTADAGEDAEICEIDTYTLADATATNYASLMWTTSGDGSFDDPTILNPVYTPGAGDIVYGSAFLTITAYGNGSCADSTDNMTLTITSEPIVYAGVDAQICETETYVLIDADAENYASLLWTTSGDGMFDDPFILHPEYFPGILDILNESVELTLTASGLGSCPDASDMMILGISPQPVAFAGPDAEICESDESYTLSSASASGYVNIKWTTDGTGTFNSMVSVNPTYTPSQMDIDNGQVTLTITAYGDGYCPDASDFMVLTIWESAEVYAGGFAEICEGENYQILDATADNYNTLAWTTSGDGLFDDATILTPIYLPGSNDIANGSVTLTLTAEGEGPCPNASDDMVLTITAAVIVSAGPDDEICELDSYTISGATASNYSSILWTTSGDGTFDDATALNPVYTPGTGDISFGSAMLTITAYGNGSCADDSDLMTLTISGAGIAFAGQDEEICEYDTYYLGDATAENYASILWTTSGDGIFDDATLLHPVYTPGPSDIATGAAILRITLFGIGSCDDVFDEMTLTLTTAPTAYAGEDADICEIDTYHLFEATATNYAFIEWTSSGNGSFNNPNAINPIYTPGSVDLAMGSVILTLYVDGNGSCEDVSDQMTLQIHSLPEVEAGDGGEICYGEEFQITDASADNFAYLLWTSSGDGTFSDDAIMEPIYYAGPLDVAAGYAELTVTAYGYGSCGSASDNLMLIVNPSPIADAGIDQVIPPGTSTILHGLASGGSGSYTFSWEPGDFIINSNAQNPTTFDLFNTTEFILKVTDNLTGCYDMDTIIVFMEQPHDPPVANDDYDTTYVNVPIVVDVLANDYDPEGGTLTPYLCAGGASNGIIVLNSDGTVTYTPYDDFVGDDSFCYYVCDDGTPSMCDSATVYIHVLPLSNIDDNIIIYNGLTPNDDGVNDTWVIEGIENYPNNEVLIFNRWGDIIKELTNYDNVNVFWNGTNKNNEVLPDGTYYYVLKILYEGQDKHYTGWIYLHGVRNK